jgi:hypothetical protein
LTCCLGITSLESLPIVRLIASVGETEAEVLVLVVEIVPERVVGIVVELCVEDMLLVIGVS